MTADLLEAQISKVLREEISSAEAASVLALTKSAATATESEIADTRADALSPLTGAEKAGRARQALSDLEFRLERLRIAIGAVADRVDHLREIELQASQKEEQALALAERDAISVRLSERVPAIVAEWIELAQLVDWNDARLDAAGLSFESAEIKARACPGNLYWPDGTGPVHRLRDAKLPAFQKHGFAWRFGDRGEIIAS